MVGYFPGLASWTRTTTCVWTSDFRGMYCSLLEQWLEEDPAGHHPRRVEPRPLRSSSTRDRGGPVRGRDGRWRRSPSPSPWRRRAPTESATPPGPPSPRRPTASRSQHTKKHIHKQKVRRNGKLVTRRRSTTPPGPPASRCRPRPAPSPRATSASPRATRPGPASRCRAAASRRARSRSSSTTRARTPTTSFRPDRSGAPAPGYSIPADPPYELGP